MNGRFFAEKKVWSDCIALYFGRGTANHRYEYALPISLKVETPEEEGLQKEPFLTVHANEAQELMDSLWQCGLRPSEGSGSAGALAATQKHLDDMRKLAFANMKVPE